MARRAIILGAAIFSLIGATPAHAVQEAKPIPTEPRIRVMLYQPDVVFKYTGHYGYQSSIEFAPDESIATISMGVSGAWMMNPMGSRLFLKPIEPDATTNMTLITNKRLYLFELHAREAQGIGDPELVFIWRFLYGSDGGAGGDSISAMGQHLDSVPIPEPGEMWRYNFNYTISGTSEIAPIRIFDDGEFTYFEFRGKNTEVPAFFLVDSQGEESLINYRMRGNYVVVERVGSRFTLRHGSDVVCVFNEAMPLRGSEAASSANAPGLNR